MIPCSRWKRSRPRRRFAFSWRAIKRSPATGFGAYSDGRRISASSAIGTADEMDRFMKAFKEIFPQKSKTTAAG